MAFSVSQGVGLVNALVKIKRFEKGLGAQLPEAYKKFWKEWKHARPAAVHYIPKDGMFERNDITGIVNPIQNIPIPLTFPEEHNDGLWGGEAIVKGFQKRNPLKRRVPHYWVPALRRSVVRSEILDSYMAVTVTERTLDLIHENRGFDHYILKTPACDLKSHLALKIKRKILLSLHSGCQNLSHDPSKQEDILKEYEKYLAQYTAEEIDWYGLTYPEAILKLRNEIKAQNPIVPHKVEFRKKLIEQLAELSKENKIDEEPSTSSSLVGKISWLSKLNPLNKKE